MLRRPHGRRPLERHRPAAERRAGIDVDADRFLELLVERISTLRVISFAAIAPHGDVDAAPELRAAMDELGRRFAASGCERSSS